MTASVYYHLMTHELLVGVDVLDEALYAEYRAAIAPLLVEFGGAFRHDVDVARTLKTDTPHPITRMFTLAFPDKARKDAFFSDSRYLAVRESYFPKAVKAITILAAYDR